MPNVNLQSEWNKVKELSHSLPDHQTLHGVCFEHFTIFDKIYFSEFDIEKQHFGESPFALHSVAFHSLSLRKYLL